MSKTKRDILITATFKLDVSQNYYDRLDGMEDADLARHILNSCFKTNLRELIGFKIDMGKEDTNLTTSSQQQVSFDWTRNSCVDCDD